MNDVEPDARIRFLLKLPLLVVSHAKLPLFRANPRRALGLYYVVGMDCGFYHDGWLHNADCPRPPTLAKDGRRMTAKDVEGFDAVVHLTEHGQP